MKMKIRLIIQSNKSSDEKYINFTDDFGIHKYNFLIPGCHLDFDGIIEIDPEIPGFPLNQTLKRI